MKAIFPLIFFLHVLGLSYFYFASPSPISLTPPNKKVAVHTVQLKKQEEKVVVNKPIPKPISKPKPNSKPQTKEVAKKTTTPSKKENLLKDAQKSLQAISSAGKPQTPKIEKVQLSNENFSDTLAKLLRDKVVLPEFGEVKIKLTLAKNGKVLSVKIVESESKKNAELVKKILGETTFTPFGNHFGGEKEHTFDIVLSNDL